MWHCQLRLVTHAAIQEYDYFFAENGLVAYKDAKVLEIQVSRRMFDQLATVCSQEHKLFAVRRA